jgi:hypothetical protein
MEQAQVQRQQQVQKEFTDDVVVWWKEETEGCEEQKPEIKRSAKKELPGRDQFGQTHCERVACWGNWGGYHDSCVKPPSHVFCCCEVTGSLIVQFKGYLVHPS